MKFIAFVSVALLLATSCKKTPDSPAQSFTATVNGIPFNAGIIKATLSNAYLRMAGDITTSNGVTIEIPALLSNDSSYTIESGAAFASYSTDSAFKYGTHGSITVHLNGKIGANGSFYFTCSDSTKVLNGSFRVLF